MAAVEPQTEKAIAGATRKPEQTVKGELISLSFWMLKQGFAEPTIKGTVKVLRTLINKGMNLEDPESAKETIAKQGWRRGTKKNAVAAYTRYLTSRGLAWDKPKYKSEETVPFIPTEEEIDQLIHSCGLKTSVFLQGLKETGADPGELVNIRWIDINAQNRTIAINHPVKGHDPRILDTSQLLIDRLQLLPKTSERPFNNTRTMYRNYHRQRNRVARKLGNPRLRSISFVTLRHWKGTMEYHKTKDIIHVKRLLGHKNIQNTMVYINLEKAVFKPGRDDEFTVKVANSLEEACQLLEVGFEYVTDMAGAKLFRKRR